MRTSTRNTAPSRPPKGGTTNGDWPLKIFALAFGGFLGLALLKFPNPPVVEHLIDPPVGGWQWALFPWPVRYAYPIVLGLVLAGIAFVRWPVHAPKLTALLPLGWFGWLLLSASQSIDPKITELTVIQFGIGLVCFFAGFLVVSRVINTGWLFGGLVVAMLVVIALGWAQHFGGLEATRQQTLLYQRELPLELLKRMEGGRIFSTMFYPNSLAGALLLVTPAILGLIADSRERFTPGARWLLAGSIGVGAAVCLAWSKSKGGWLLALGMAVVVLLRLPVRRQLKVGVVSLLVLVGVAGFVVRYAGFFKKGAPSVVQRFNYWSAAAQNVTVHPVFGSGPGTFGTVYKRMKPPEAEMARLAHNDYLQQASDSGVLAGGLFLASVGWVLVRTRGVWRGAGWMRFGVWLGLVGFAAQAFVEFGFYVPATAWCWFGLAGWLVAQAGLGFDKGKPTT